MCELSRGHNILAELYCILNIVAGPMSVAPNVSDAFCLPHREIYQSENVRTLIRFIVEKIAV